MIEDKPTRKIDLRPINLENLLINGWEEVSEESLKVFCESEGEPKSFVERVKVMHKEYSNSYRKNTPPQTLDEIIKESGRDLSPN